MLSSDDRKRRDAQRMKMVHGDNLDDFNRVFSNVTNFMKISLAVGILFSLACLALIVVLIAHFV